jgi:putative ABC transport system ATP-binding protein
VPRRVHGIDIDVDIAYDPRRMPATGAYAVERTPIRADEATTRRTATVTIISMRATEVVTMTTTMVSAPAARAEAITKQYGSGDAAVRAVDGVTLEIPRAALTAIMGPSGSGKSTLLHCMAALDTVTSGRVLVGEHDLGTMSERELTVLRRDRIGFVFQAFNLVPTLTALENITLPLTLAGRRAEPRWLDELVTTVGLADRLGHRPSELSGGQQQRAAVARALVTRPQIVFADEPTGNLDSRSGADILGFLRRAADDFDQTVVMVTHDPVAASYADSVVFLADGRVVDRMDAPSAQRVLDRMKAFGG